MSDLPVRGDGVIAGHRMTSQRPRIQGQGRMDDRGLNSGLRYLCYSEVDVKP